MQSSENKQVAIIGGGIAGLTVADVLGRWGIETVLIEQNNRLGGHAAQLSCKATDRCVQCGACLVEDKRRRVASCDRIHTYIGTRISSIRCTNGFELDWRSDHDSGVCTADAIVVATGFSAYDPSAKNFGYGYLPNVMTSLEADRMLRRQGRLTRSTDGAAAQKIGFIQCVGSRDHQIGHNWCSKICCGSALRTLNLIKHRQPETQTVLFYIDVQTFGYDFQNIYDRAGSHMTMIRAIPGEILAAQNDGLKALYFDNNLGHPQEMLLDLVILSVGLCPAADNATLAAMLGWELSSSGFFTPHSDPKPGLPAGIFIAGTAQGPMSIAESAASAEKTAADLSAYLCIPERSS